MPKTTRGGGARKDELPGTIERSDPKAQRTFAKAHDSAAEEYGDEERAHRVAYSALKHTHEKVGDHWQPKDSQRSVRRPRRRWPAQQPADTAGGVDARASKKHLLDGREPADVPGRSTMTKDELAGGHRQGQRPGERQRPVARTDPAPSSGPVPRGAPGRHRGRTPWGRHGGARRPGPW